MVKDEIVAWNDDLVTNLSCYSVLCTELWRLIHVKRGIIEVGNLIVVNIVKIELCSNVANAGWCI